MRKTKSCQKTFLKAIYVFVLTVADSSPERMKLSIVIHLLTQRVKTVLRTFFYHTSICNFGMNLRYLWF
jgi:hypothetical protein